MGEGQIHREESEEGTSSQIRNFKGGGEGGTPSQPHSGMFPWGIEAQGREILPLGSLARLRRNLAIWLRASGTS